jgi:hypothetical protein
MNQLQQIEISRLIQGSFQRIQDMVFENIVFGYHSEEDVQMVINNYFSENMGDEFRMLKIEVEEI